MEIPEANTRKTLLETVKVGRYSVKVFFELNDIILQASRFTMRFPEQPSASVRVKRDSRPAAALLDKKDKLQELHDIVVRVKATADSKPKNFRIPLDLSVCKKCGNSEYACICDE